MAHVPLLASWRPLSIPTARASGRAACALVLAVLSATSPAASETSVPGPARPAGAVAIDTPVSTAPRDLPFAAFWRTPIGPRGLDPTPALRAADGTRVRLAGHVVTQEAPLPGHLLLAPVPVRLSEHADGDADDLPPATVAVRLPPAWRDRPPPHPDGVVSLVGTLHVGRAEGPDGRVTWVQLDAEEPAGAPDLPTAPVGPEAPAAPVAPVAPSR